MVFVQGETNRPMESRQMPDINRLMFCDITKQRGKGQSFQWLVLGQLDTCIRRKLHPYSIHYHTIQTSNFRGLVDAHVKGKTENF